MIKNGKNPNYSGVAMPEEMLSKMRPQINVIPV